MHFIFCELTLSIYRYLRRYWERGQTADALLPDYGNSGAKGRTRGASVDSVDHRLARIDPQDAHGAGGQAVFQHIISKQHAAIPVQVSMLPSMKVFAPCKNAGATGAAMADQP